MRISSGELGAYNKPFSSSIKISFKRFEDKIIHFYINFKFFDNFFFLF